MSKRVVDDDTIAAGAVVNVAQYLKGIEFPATLEDVERLAKKNGADESALEEIRAMDRNRFETPDELFAEIGAEVKHALEAGREHEGRGDR